MRASTVVSIAALVCAVAGFPEPASADHCSESSGGGSGSQSGGKLVVIGDTGERRCEHGSPGTSSEFEPYHTWETWDIYVGYRGGCAEGEFRGVRRYYYHPEPGVRVHAFDSEGCVPDPRLTPFVPGVVDEIDVRAVLEGQLPTPSVGRNPSGDGLVQLETHLWYEGGGISTVTLPDGRTCDGYEMHATEGAIQLDAWVCVTGYEWDMGNGDTVTASRPGSAEDPAAEYVYERTGDYDLVATTVWEGFWHVAWGGGTDSGTFGSPIRMSSAPETFRVLQVRSAPVNRG